MIKLLKNKKGMGYLEVVILVLVAMMLIVLSLNVFTFLSVKQDLDYYAKEMVTIATTTGKIEGDRISERKEELTEDTGLTPNVTYTANEFDSSGKIQSGEIISVTLTYNTSFKGFGSLNFPLTISTSYSGVSEIYWK